MNKVKTNKTLCDSCYGCARMEEKNFVELFDCIDYQSTRDALRERVNEAYRNIEKYQQVKFND